MAKKNFAEGIEAVLGGGTSQLTPKKRVSPIENESNKNPKERTSITMESSLLEKLRAIVYWERTTLKIEIERAIELYLNSKESLVVDQALKHFRARKPSGKIKG